MGFAYPARNMVYLRFLLLVFCWLSAAHAQQRAPEVLVLDQATISQLAAERPSEYPEAVAGPLSPLPNDWRDLAANLPAQKW